NRGYLICSSLFSFVIPFLQIGSFNGLVYGNTAMDLVYINPNLGKMQNNGLSLAASGNIMVAVYLLIAALFIIKLFISFYKIISLAIRSRREKLEGIIYIELSSSATAFSFFNLLFINPSSTEKPTILKHEMVHIRQGHSLDILFFELLKIFNWFNPIVWLIQKDIKLLHEYIADAVTTNSDVQKHEYAMFLIQNSFGVTPNYLTNQIFNQSILKRRINMLNKKRSAGAARLKILLTVPVVGGMLFASTLAFSKDYEMIDLYPEKYSVDNSQVATIKPIQEPLAKKKRFKLSHKISEKTKTFSSYDNRLVVINGNSSQSGVIMEVEGYDKLVELNAKEATAKYGSGAASGALVFTGKNTKILSVRDDIRFPPPIVVKDDRIPTPQKPGNKSRYRTVDANGEKIKFPPPIIVKDRPIPPPPPPIKPLKPEPATKNEQTKLEGTGQFGS
ncbi:MAG: M56 family metallopeptidase, partial [Pedobacter sp.]|nr:M56 family metallopeptidase [Pedobacter sp.]